MAKLFDFLNKDRNTAEIREKEKGRMLLGAEKTAAYEDYVQATKNLAYGLGDNSCNKIMIAAARAGNGAAIVAANIAIVLAEEGKRVLLVDNMCQNPVLHTYLNVSGTEGIAQYLSAKPTNNIDFIVSTSVEKLFLAPLYTPIPTFDRLVSSAPYKAFLAEQAQAFDWIIICAPDLVSSNVAVAIGTLCDGSVLVVNKNKDNTGLIKLCKEKLHANLIGAVLYGDVE